jgi:hypothetical protein
MLRHAQLSPLSIIALSVAGCGSEPLVREEPSASGTAAQSLIGEAIYEGCSAQQSAVFDRAHMRGRVVANSRAFEQCVQRTIGQRKTVSISGATFGPYVRCGDEQTANAPDVMAASRSGRDLGVTCAPTTNVWGWSGTLTETEETFTFATVAITEAAKPNPDLAELAATMWHEVMHDNGWEHEPKCKYPAGTAEFASSAVWIVDACISHIMRESERTCAGSTQGCVRGMNIITGLDATGAPLKTCECVADPRPWSPWFDLANAGSAQGNTPVAALSTTPSGTSLFWTAPDGAVRTTYFDPSTAAPAWVDPFDLAPAGAALPGSAVTAISPMPGGSSLFWVAGDGSVRSTYYDPRVANPAWAEPFALTDAGAAEAGSRIAALAASDGSVRLFWIAGGRVRSTFYDARSPTQGWVPAFDLTAPDTASGHGLAAIAQVERGSQLFWVQPDGAIASVYYDPRSDQAAWTGPFALTDAGETVTDAQVSAISLVPGAASVYWVDRRGAVRSTYFDPRVANPTWAEAFDLAPPNSAVATTGVAIASPVPNGTSLFWTASDGQVWSTYFDPRVANPVWVAPFPLPKPGEAPNASVTALAIQGVQGATSLFHTTADGRVRSSYYDPRN